MFQMASISISAVLYFTISQHTFGKHLWDVPISLDSVSSIQNYIILSILPGPTLFLAKLSVLLLYLELFKVDDQARIAIAIGVATIAAQGIATIVGNTVLCVPKPGGNWMLKASTHGCTKTATAFGVATGTLSVFNDIYILWIPLPIIWQLHLPTRKKVGVSIIFITGLFALAASIIALIYRIRQYRGGDNTWLGVYTYTVVVVELNVSIMCSCMPSYAICYRHHLPAFRSLQYRIRSKLYSSNKQGNPASKFGIFEREDSDNSGGNIKLTLGSALRDGKFLQTQHIQTKEWPLETVEKGDKRTQNMTGSGV
ncbi:hypothetical protein G7Y79_00031g065920 [Physcia stellaris]|nr:hypothetical protein G7Y79_00031g065920 [Physcia stellaris]